MSEAIAKAVGTSLPTDKKALAQIICRNMDLAEREMDIRMTRWRLAQLYLKEGIRRFDVYSPGTRQVRGFSVDKEGKYDLQVQELMSQSNKIMGLLMSQDVRPDVNMTGLSLDGIRNRALAELIANGVIDEMSLEKTQQHIAFYCHYFGLVGLQGRTAHSSAVGLYADLETIPAWEIFPFPALGMDHTKQQGIIRQRLYPLAALEDRYPSAKLKQHLSEMDAFIDTIGNPLDDPETINSLEPEARGNITSTPNDLGERGEQVVVKVRELWMYGPRGTASRMVVSSGDYIIEDIEFTNVQTYVPIATARFIETGGFYGAGLFDLLFSTVREFEKMVKDLVNNVKEMDAYPITILPAGTIRTAKMFKDDGNGMKYATYSIDPKMALSQQALLKPITIAPTNSGEQAGKVAEFLKGMIDQVSPVRDLSAEKGRIDSLPALQFLDESEHRKTTMVSKNLRMMYGQVYRSVTASAALDLMLRPTPIPITKLNLGLAGAVIDFDSGTIQFGNRNQLPELARLSFGIKEDSPRSEALRKGEALSLYQQQLMDYDRLVLFMLEEGLNPAMWLRPEESAYESIVYNILKLYNDGVEPGQIIITPHTERPEIQLIVLNAFMGGGKMRVASVDVQNAFADYRETLMTYMGVMLPTPVPDPLDQALVSAAQQDVLAQQAGGQQGPKFNVRN